jgi:hypothetical protein
MRRLATLLARKRELACGLDCFASARNDEDVSVALGEVRLYAGWYNPVPTQHRGRGDDG